MVGKHTPGPEVIEIIGAGLIAKEVLTIFSLEFMLLHFLVYILPELFFSL